MRTLLLALALTHPAPVTSIDAAINLDGSVRLDWTLPSDPSVVGVTILRERWNGSDDVIFELVGLSSTFTDTGADPDRSYVYWVHTRDASGDLSTGAFVEVIGDDGGHDSWHCSSGATAPPGNGLLIPLAALAALLLVRRRLGP